MVHDGDDLWMLYIPTGVVWAAPADDHDAIVAAKMGGRDWTLRAQTWTGTHVLSFAWPGSGHAILHFWDERWAPRCWYVNVEAPLRRYDLGFDTLDHDLDLVVTPDRSAWEWKDEADVDLGVERGLYSPGDAIAFRREAERGLRRLRDREPPFDREWRDWRPDPSWPIPELPEGWDRITA